MCIVVQYDYCTVWLFSYNKYEYMHIYIFLYIFIYSEDIFIDKNIFQKKWRNKMAEACIVPNIIPKCQEQSSKYSCTIFGQDDKRTIYNISKFWQWNIRENSALHCSLWRAWNTWLESSSREFRVINQKPFSPLWFLIRLENRSDLACWGNCVSYISSFL